MEISEVACKLHLRFTTFAFLCAALFSFSYRTFGQSQASGPTPGVFRSDVDDLLTVEKVSVFPFTDNLQGIYARPLEAHFISLIQKMHRWDYVPANSSGPILSPEELEGSVDKAKQASANLGADAFFACRVVKGPGGVMIHLSLFLSKDGKLLSQAILKDYKQFDIVDLKEQLERLLSEINARLPYAGRVMSREGNRVTVNLGLKDGVQNGQLLSVIQILQAHRHPKFNFLIKTEKEIFGKIKVLKVDDTLSFGMVVTEKEKGAIQKNSKIGSLDFVTYAAPESLSLNPTAEEALSQRDDGNIAFGKNARAWSPAQPPSFGQLGFRLGLGRFAGATDIQGVGGLEGTNNFAPSVILDGELWITPNWTFAATLKHGIISVRNPHGGGQPSELSQALTYYEASIGYTIRIGPYIYSPNVTPFFGYFNYRLYVDESNPEAFTTQQYSGARFGVRGTMPVGDNGQYGFGGVFSTAWRPTLHEAPAPSGDTSTASAIQFGVLGYKKYSERLRLQANLEFEMYSASFSGAGGRNAPSNSASQRYTTLSAGLYYMF